MVRLTIFTPTFNRINTLKKLYDSLLIQTNKEFEWIIIDDGSTDHTEEMVKGWLKGNNQFPISYRYKKNEGKHIAINEGAKVASGKWFFIVDSDDMLTSNAIERVLHYCDSIDNIPSFAGVVGLRGNQNGEAWNNWYQEGNARRLKSNKSSIENVEYLDATSIEYRYKYKVRGDRAEVIRTDLLRRYPFPKFSGEKFLVESYLWLQLANDGYKFRWFNSIIYLTEYLQDGLTNNIEEHYKKSPLGSMAVYNLMVASKGLPLTEKNKAAYNYCIYGFYAGKSHTELFKTIKNKAVFPIGLFLATIRKK